jgi:hypothetical protein
MSCRDVCISSDLDDYAEFYRDGIVRAAKPYVCEECRNAIAVGESHQYATGKYDGDWFSVRTCLICAEVRSAFACGGTVFGQLWAEMDEQVFPKWNAMVAIDCLAKLTTDAAIAKVRAEYAEWKEDNEQ